MYYDDLDYMLEDYDEDMDYEDDGYDYEDDGYDYDDDDYYNEAVAIPKLASKSSKITVKEKYAIYVTKCQAKNKAPLPFPEWDKRRRKARKAATIAGIAAGTLATGAAVLGGQHAYVTNKAAKKYHIGGYRKGLHRQHKRAANKYIRNNSWVMQGANGGLKLIKQKQLKPKFFKEDMDFYYALEESGITDPDLQLAFAEGYYSVEE